jgi:hypothetical protein
MYWFISVLTILDIMLILVIIIEIIYIIYIHSSYYWNDAGMIFYLK